MSRTAHVVVCEHRKKERLRFQEVSQVAQRQTKILQPVFIDEDLEVFRFEGRNQLLRLRIKLFVQQVDDRRRKVPVVRRQSVNLACYEAQTGSLDRAKAHLKRATEIDAKFRLMAVTSMQWLRGRRY